MTTSGVQVFVILVISILTLYGIGRAIRNRTRMLQITLMIAALLVVFLSLAYIGNSLAVDLYAFDQGKPCQDSTSTCVTEREQAQAFNSHVPSLTLWLTVPKPLRPACATISPEFCTLEKNYDSAPVSYLFGGFGALIALFVLLLGLRQKREKIAVIPVIAPEGLGS